MARKKTTPCCEVIAARIGGVGDKPKKGLVIDDDEYSSGMKLSEESQNQEEKVAFAPIMGKKKDRKANSKKSQEEDGEKVVEEDKGEDEVWEIKNKPKSKKGDGGGMVFSTSKFGLPEEDGDDNDNDNDNGKSGLSVDKGSEEEDEPVVSFSGKKLSKKASSKKNSNLFSASASAFGGIGNDEGGVIDHLVEGNKVEDADDAPVISFSGKKKSSKSNRKPAFTTSTFTGLDNEEEVDAKKEEDDVFELKQPSLGTSRNEVDDSKINKQEEVAETSKSKKKKKRSGRTAQEEDELVKLLAELGEGPSVAKTTAPPLPEQKIHVQPESVASVDGAIGEKEGEEEGTESAAARKKKKKKEKEKEKKAAAVSASAVEGNKKVPKHVREKQEALARRKEAEERKKREEEESLRKEEEELRRLEELERQAEEARLRKKEREKEKLLKKKQEGKLFTRKQKEEARRLEAMRRQILANAGGLPVHLTDTSSSSTTTKRPTCQTKKSKPVAPQANGAMPVPSKSIESVDVKESLLENVVDGVSCEAEREKEVESINVEVKLIEENGVEEGDGDDDNGDEWDAKSWDDADIELPNKGAVADEEVESEPEKSAVASSRDKPTVPVKKISSAPPAKSEDLMTKKFQSEVDVLEKNKRKEAAFKKEAPKSGAVPKTSEENLRSPICCILGHVDTGKTKLLDCIRGTNVQEGEAGGITQQIGATYFPSENIRERTKELKADAKLNVPGLLVIDTPGHESFTNLRSRGSGLCDIAILMVDIMHGLEPQTIESLNLLKMRNTEFIVALNKVDRLYGWKTCRNAPIVKAMKQQSPEVEMEFNSRLTHVITQFKEHGLNTQLYYKNKEMGETFSIVPTSAISGEGVPDLLLLLVLWTQKTMIEKLKFSDKVQCTVLEVKVVEGHGTTIDVVLVNGVLHEGDQIVVCGMQGPIVTTIRSLLTPHPMKELRVKGTYLHHKEIKAAQGVKITAQGLEYAVAGTGLYVVGLDDDLEDVKEATMEDMKSVFSRVDKSGLGVCVQASTLGSLEALLEFLKTPQVNIPVSGVSIGPVHKKDVMKASVMLEKRKEYAAILAFDVKVTPEARELADELGVKIFIADIIYHLFDQFEAYIHNLKEEKKKESANEVVFPCRLKIIPNCIFNKKDPIVLGVEVRKGIARVGTPICIPDRDFIGIGRIASIENNHKPVDIAKKGQKVAIKIVGSNPDEQQKIFGRHFELEDELVSHITRRSIDVLKANFRDDLSSEEWKLVVELKNEFKMKGNICQLV